MAIAHRPTDRDFIWKMIIGGQGGVGKTTILYRFVHDQFIEKMKMTIGVDFHKKIVNRQGCAIELILWDLGGQDRFRLIQPDYIRGASGGFVCFDTSKRSTLEDAREWIAMFRKFNHPDDGKRPMPIVLVGTKYDLIENDPEQAKMVIDDATVLAQEQGILGPSITSAKTGFNVDETIHYMVDVLLENSNSGTS